MSGKWKAVNRIFVVLLGLSVQPLAQADISTVLPMCTGCHGSDGVGIEANIPTIGGMPATLQENALNAYKNGDRKCGDVPLMCNIVGGLADDQVKELAAHYAAMTYVPANEEFDAALAEQGKAIHDADCLMCHGTDPGTAQFGVLHGQRKAFLQYALSQYAAGERTQMPMMEAKTTPLTAEQIEALVNYYASYRE